MPPPSLAIVAHFSPDGVFDANFRLLLTCVAPYVDEIVIVSTGDLNEGLPAGLEKITLIRRPNIGYDFYSYKVGIFEAFRRHPQLGRLIMLNSSFFIVDAHRFSAAVGRAIEMAEHHDVVGATESYQFGWHIQSYFMVLSERVLSSAWCERFFRRVNPRNSKFELITEFEVGFSQALRKSGATAKVLFQPRPFAALRSKCWWLARVASSPRGFRQILRGPLSVMRQTNLVHFAAAEIARDLGYVKAEVLRDNPHRLGRRYIEAINAHEMTGLVEHIQRQKVHYARSIDGLSLLMSPQEGLPRFTSATFGEQDRKGVRVAVVAHIFYEDLIPELVARLRNIPEPFDLFITTPCEGFLPEIFQQFTAVSDSVTVHVSENRGRDIGPFIALLRTGRLSCYLAVLKLHSKKSTYSAHGAAWRHAFYAKLLRDMATVRQIIGLFETGFVGVVGPEEYYLSDRRFWGANKQAMKRLLRAMRLGDPDDELKLGFFAGSMFWFSPSAFRPLLDVEESELAFEAEMGAQDGTLAHAIERLFCAISRSQGFANTSAELAGREIDRTETSENTVPVL